MAQFPWVNSQLSVGRLITLNCFCHGRGSAWNRQYRYGFAFLPSNASAKIIIHGFAELLIHHHGIQHNIASDSPYNKNEKVHAHRIHQSHLVTQHPETASLIKWPFEDSVTASAGWQYLEGLCALPQYSVCGAVPIIAKIHGSETEVPGPDWWSQSRPLTG